MFNTPQNQTVANWMMSNYQRKIQEDIAFATGQQQPYYLPTAIRLGPMNPAIIDGTPRYHKYSGGVLGDACCTGCGEGKQCSGGAMADYSRFVGGQGIKSLNGVEPSKASGTQSYTTATPSEMKVGGSGPSSVVDMTDQIRGSMNPMLMNPIQDKEPETLAGVRRVHGGRRKMTEEEKKAWGEMMKKARAKKRGGKKEKNSEIHIDINSHKNEPNDDEKKKGGVKVYKKGSNKKLEGGMAPVNTFTAKSSPVISGKGRKSKMTAEERKAWGAKMKALREAKKSKK